MLSRRTLATPRGEGAVTNGTVESLTGIINNTQPVQVSQLPKMFHEHDKDNMCPLDEGRDSMSVSEAPKKEKEEPEAVRPLHAPYAAPTRAKNPEPPPWPEEASVAAENTITKAGVKESKPGVDVLSVDVHSEVSDTDKVEKKEFVTKSITNLGDDCDKVKTQPEDVRVVYQALKPFVPGMLELSHLAKEVIVSTKSTPDHNAGEAPPDANKEDRINFNTGYDVFHVNSYVPQVSLDQIFSSQVLSTCLYREGLHLHCDQVCFL